MEGHVKQVVVLGGTGYLERPLIEGLLQDGFPVAAAARTGSEAKLPSGCAVITGGSLDFRTYRDRIPPGSTFVHLVGTPHPAPWKALEFRSVDLVSRCVLGLGGKRLKRMEPPAGVEPARECPVDRRK